MPAVAPQIEWPKEVIQQTIFEHQYSHQLLNGKCSCGKRFEFAEEWARHLRIRIRKAIEEWQQFQPQQ